MYLNIEVLPSKPEKAGLYKLNNCFIQSFDQEKNLESISSFTMKGFDTRSSSNDDNEFIRCFHQLVSPIFSMNFSQFEQLKKKTKKLFAKKVFFLSLPVEK